jgi:D-alanyl-D-alanine carboxypeptidase/D-alanyl-D-alanine-endopeptidase (penicillin-binding protein 4)
VLLGATCTLLAAPPTAEAISRVRLEQGLSKQMHRVGGGSGAWVSDLDAAGHGPLFSWAAKTPRILASNSKLFTTAAALHRFGVDGRLETRLYPHPRTAVHPHAIRGDLVIAGDGDPALASRGFAKRNNLPLTPIGALARGLHRDGIRRVLGKVEADDTIFDRRRGVPTTGVDASGELSPLSGLSYDSGFDGSHYARRPELEAARALRAKLRQHHIRVKGGVGRANLSEGALEHSPLAAVSSPRMSTLVMATNRPSNNFFAEMMLKRLGASATTKGTTSAEPIRRSISRPSSAPPSSCRTGRACPETTRPRQNQLVASCGRWTGARSIWHFAGPSPWRGIKERSAAVCTAPLRTATAGPRRGR